MPCGRTPDDLLEDWRNRLNKIEEDMWVFHHNREMLDGLLELADGVDPLLEPEHFVEWVREMYAVTQAAVVRRHARDGVHDTGSLAHLLRSMKGHANIIERGWFLTKYSADAQAVGEASWDAEFGAGAQHLTEAGLRSDVGAFKLNVRAITAWVDEYVAHSSATQGSTSPTFGDLERALDEVARVFGRYRLLVAQRDGQLTPIMQYEWKMPFHRAWVKDADFDAWYARQKKEIHE